MIVKGGIAQRNWRCNFRPAIARMKPSVRWKNEPARAPSRAHADVESERGGRKVGVCVRCCAQHRAHNLLTRSVSACLLASRLTIYRLSNTAGPCCYRMAWPRRGGIAAHETSWSSLSLAFGMVHANVGQKRLKRYILRRFFLRSSLAIFT